MQRAEDYHNERLDHLGIAAGVCQEIRLAAGWTRWPWPTTRRQLRNGYGRHNPHGLGFSNRQLYLVPQFFTNKPMAHLLEAGITAEASALPTAQGPQSLVSIQIQATFHTYYTAMNAHNYSLHILYFG